MSSSKDIISSQKPDEGVSSEIENEPGIKEGTDFENNKKDENKIRMKEKPETEFDNETTVNDDLGSDSEWENRILCSDGNCIGVIGPDGRCKECGKPNSETEPEYIPNSNETQIFETSSTDENDDISQNPEELNKISDTETDGESDYSSEEESESDWENRTLCSDGNCIGVIGPDGRCKECGKPYEE
jgi:hypothetical protein